MEKETLDGMEPMLRIALKGKLMKDINMILAENEKYKKCHSWIFHRRANKTLNKDFKKGLKQINKKVPVFVELPKYAKYNDDAYKVSSANSKKKKKDLPPDDIVYPEKIEQKRFDMLNAPKDE